MTKSLTVTCVIQWERWVSKFLHSWQPVLLAVACVGTAALLSCSPVSKHTLLYCWVSLQTRLLYLCAYVGEELTFFFKFQRFWFLFQFSQCWYVKFKCWLWFIANAAKCSAFFFFVIRPLFLLISCLLVANLLQFFEIFSSLLPAKVGGIVWQMGSHQLHVNVLCWRLCGWSSRERLW